MLLDCDSVTLTSDSVSGSTVTDNGVNVGRFVCDVCNSACLADGDGNGSVARDAGVTERCCDSSANGPEFRCDGGVGCLGFLLSFAMDLLDGPCRCGVGVGSFRGGVVEE